MTSPAPAPVSQLTLNLEPSIVDRWPTLRKFLSHRVDAQVKTAKQIAGDMDISPSTLSKKLNPGEADNNRFTVDNLERTGEKRRGPKGRPCAIWRLK